MNTQLKIGLALGSGSSRGWSHIGIIKELANLGIKPDIVCGTSVGAMVGAAYVAGNIQKLESWARSVTKIDVARFLNISTSFTGFVNTQRFHEFLNENIASDDDVIEDHSKGYAAISTDLETGKEVYDSRSHLPCLPQTLTDTLITHVSILPQQTGVAVLVMKPHFFQGTLIQQAHDGSDK